MIWRSSCIFIVIVIGIYRIYICEYSYVRHDKCLMIQDQMRHDSQITWCLDHGWLIRVGFVMYCNQLIYRYRRKWKRFDTYVRICGKTNCAECLQASTHDLLIFLTFSRNSGLSRDCPMWINKSLNNAIWLFISTISWKYEDKKKLSILIEIYFVWCRWKWNEWVWMGVELGIVPYTLTSLLNPNKIHLIAFIEPTEWIDNIGTYVHTSMNIIVLLLWFIEKDKRII